MANGGAGAVSGNAIDFAKLEANQAKQMEQQTKMQEFQQKVNFQNTTMTAISTMLKGNDDVLRSIANSLK